MKVDMEAMKEQMTTMMEAMISLRRMMEVNAATVVAASTSIEVDPTHPPSFNQVNHPALDMVGQGGKALESAGGPILCRFRTSIPFNHMACLPTIHHSMLHTLPMRMSTTPHPYPLRSNNPNLIMHMSLNPWGRHMKHPETTI